MPENTFVLLHIELDQISFWPEVEKRRGAKNDLRIQHIEETFLANGQQIEIDKLGDNFVCLSKDRKKGG